MLLHFQKPIKNPSLLDSDNFVIIRSLYVIRFFQVQIYYSKIKGSVNRAYFAKKFLGNKKSGGKTHRHQKGGLK